MNSEPQTNKSREESLDSATTKSGIQKSVLEKIQQREVNMRPRVFFMLKLVGLGVLTFFILILSILICNFVSFIIRLNGHDQLLAFGDRGILLFFQLFPWPLFILDVVLIFLLRQLMRQFKFGYRSPWLPAIILITAISIAGGLLLDRATPINDSLLHQADEGHLPPPLGAFYKDSRSPQQPGMGEYRGVIEKIQGNELFISNPMESTTSLLTVLKPQQGPDAHEAFTIGEPVICAGQFQNGVFQAFGIRPIDADDFLPFPDQDDDSH
jgi:hypothetical protein